MTTVRRVFESYDFDIGLQNFFDVFESLAETRDLSMSTLQSLYQGRMGSRALPEGEQLHVRTVIMLDDCYEQMREDQLLVFDSDIHDHALGNLPSIKEVLADRKVLHATQLDQFMTVSVEI